MIQREFELEGNDFKGDEIMMMMMIKQMLGSDYSRLGVCWNQLTELIDNLVSYEIRN